MQLLRKPRTADFSAESFRSFLKMREICLVKGASSGRVKALVAGSGMLNCAFAGRIAAYWLDWTAANICVIDEQLSADVPLNAERKRVIALAYSPSPVSVQKGMP